jgi:glycosyltransferase involved in cell wall biosynthesis
MTLYIPQNIDPFNTHLKNLIEAYRFNGVTVTVGYEAFLDEKFIPDVFHVHFLEGLLKYINYDIELLFRKLNLYKERGTKFLYTAHDLRPHGAVQNIDFPEVFERYLTYVDMIIHHGQNSIKLLTEAYPVLQGKRHIVCHHGDYLNDMKQFNTTKESARKILGLPPHKKIVLIFGQLQYKNTSFAEEVFEKVQAEIKESVLILAGVSPIFPYNKLNKIYYAFNNKILNLFRRKTLKIHKRFSQYETYLIFRAADVIFLPHKSGLTSGIIAMSATLARPFVYPNIGIFQEQAQNCAAIIYNSGDTVGAANGILDILSKEIESFDNSLWLADNNWRIHTENILKNLRGL